MLKVAFVGAGRRAQSAHYPAIDSLSDVGLEAVAELEGGRLEEVVNRYRIPRAYSDFQEMIEEVEPEAVYVIMGETFMTKVAVECMDAGKHVFIEKPAGANVDETRQLLEAAERNDVFCMVGFQRRFASVTQEALRLTRAHGPATLAIGEFHKSELSIGPNGDSTMWSDVCHMVDWVRYVVGSEAVEVNAYQDTRLYELRDNYNALIRFADDAVGIVTASRTSGGRYMRSELHGIGVGCYMRIPQEMEILEVNEESRTVTGAKLAGVEADDVQSYDGMLVMHQHFVDCIRTGQTPSTDIRDVIHTSRLVARLEGRD